MKRVYNKLQQINDKEINK